MVDGSVCLSASFFRPFSLGYILRYRGIKWASRSPSNDHCGTMEAPRWILGPLVWIWGAFWVRFGSLAGALGVLGRSKGSLEKLPWLSLGGRGWGSKSSVSIGSARRLSMFDVLGTRDEHVRFWPFLGGRGVRSGGTGVVLV